MTTTPPPYGRIARPDDVPLAARPVSAAAWRFLVEQWDSGLFDVAHVEMTPGASAHIATFHDDGERLLLRAMAYSETLGLYSCAAFPEERDVAEERATSTAAQEGYALYPTPLPLARPMQAPSDDAPEPLPSGSAAWYGWAAAHAPCAACGMHSGTRLYRLAHPLAPADPRGDVHATLCAACAASSIAVAQVYLADYEEAPAGRGQ